MRILVSLLIVGVSAFPALAAEGGAFPPFDARTFAGQLFWLAITFGGLYLLMSRVALPRVGAILEDRRQTIDAALQAADAAQKQAEQAALAQEQALAKAKAGAQQIAQAARDKSAKEIEAKRQTIETELSGKMVAAEARISEMKAKAMGNVDDIAKDAVAAIVEQLTGKAPTAAAIAKAVAASSEK